MKGCQGSWTRIVVIVLVCEKILQHTLVTVAFYKNWNGIRSTVAVNPDVLMVLGGIVAVLFVISLWGLITRRIWVTSLLIGLALFDIIGEFVAQGTIIIDLTVSFVVGIILLVFVLVLRRQMSKVPTEGGNAVNT
jgi:hypothetical protein